MNKIFCRILFFICIFFTSFITLFQIHTLHGQCMAVGLETALWNGMNIASEYVCGRAGRKLHNANEVSANIDGINLGTVSGDYTSLQANASGISVPFNLDYINQYTTDVDFSSLSAEDQQKLAAALADDPSANNGSWIFKKCTYGYVTLYWCVDQLGNWVGSSLNNIMCTLDTKSASQTLALETSSETLYPDNKPLITKSFSCSYTWSANDWQRNTINFSKPVFLYGYNGSLYCVAPSGTYFSYVYTDQNGTQTGSSATSFSGSTVGTFNNELYLDSGSLSTVYGVRCSYDFGSLSNITSYLNNGSGTLTINSELVDTNQDGYAVPDIGENFASIISDIYEVIDSLRDGVIGAIDDGFTTTIDDSLADAIADAIADALSKGLAITDENSGGNGGGGSTEDPTWSLPTWIIPPFIQDIFPEGTFELFRPIFYIVPEAYTSYSLWILIPTIILFVIFIYFVVSVL